MSNDNKKHPMFSEFRFWRDRCCPELRGVKELPIDIQRVSFDRREQMLRNYIWFFKFELSFLHTSRQERKKHLKVINGGG